MKMRFLVARIAFCLQTLLYIVRCSIEKIKHSNFCFLLLTPAHTNYGDHAIAAAEKCFISDCGGYCCEITGDLLSRFINYPRLFKLMMGGSPILIQGGGYLGTLWYDSGERLLQEVLRTVPENEIVIFPQTIYYDDTPQAKMILERSQTIYGNCKNLTIVAREKQSFEKLEKLYPENRVILAPDIVLYCKSVTLGKERKGALLLLRGDCEKTLSDAESRELLGFLSERFAECTISDMCAENKIKPETRNIALESKYMQFASAELAVTDRLHGMIFAAVTGTPCIVMNSKSPKVKGIYDWIFADYEYICFTENFNEMAEFAERIKGKTYLYDNSEILPLFDELKEIIRKEIC